MMLLFPFRIFNSSYFFFILFYFLVIYIGIKRRFIILINII